MTILTDLINSWSTYEKVQEIILLGGIFLVSQIGIYFMSKNRNLLILSSITFAIAAMLNVLSLVLLNVLFKIEITEVFRIVPILTSILLVSNLGIFVGFYVHKIHKKNFTLEKVRLEYFTDTAKQTIFLLLLASSIFLFVSVQTQAILVSSVISCIGSIWATYGISRYILK